MSTPASADVVVVGSGVCGAMVAYQLARSGASVLMLEAGPRGERSDFVQRLQALPPYNNAHGDLVENTRGRVTDSRINCVSCCRTGSTVPCKTSNDSIR